MKSKTFVRIILLGIIPSALIAQQEKNPVYDDTVRPVHIEELKYPSVLQAANVHGIVVVMVKLNDNGQAVSASAVSGPRQLIKTAVDNSMKWRFEPNPQKSAVIIYDFRLEGVCGGGDLVCSSMFSYRRPNIAVITGQAMLCDHC
jgi:TonB-like protein